MRWPRDLATQVHLGPADGAGGSLPQPLRYAGRAEDVRAVQGDRSDGGGEADGAVVCWGDDCLEEGEASLAGRGGEGGVDGGRCLVHCENLLLVMAI